MHMHTQVPTPVLTLGPVCCLSCTLHLLLLQAANYLNIKGLLDLTCQTVANMIKGQ
jgi:hypothetical protein